MKDPYLKYSEVKGLYYCYEGKYSGEEYIKSKFSNCWLKVFPMNKGKRGRWATEPTPIGDLPNELKTQALIMGIKL